jgi:hypothetical protein
VLDVCWGKFESFWPQSVSLVEISGATPSSTPSSAVLDCRRITDIQEQTPTRGANCVRARERERGLKRSALWWGKIRQRGGRNKRSKSGKERAPFTAGCTEEVGPAIAAVLLQHQLAAAGAGGFLHLVPLHCPLFRRATL